MRASERFFVAGQNGSGKSVLASAVANAWPRVLVYDPKDDPEAELPNMAICYGVRAALRALPGRVLYRPTAAEMRSVGVYFDELVEVVYQRGAHGIVIHELGDLGATDRELGPYLSAATRQGRSRRIPIVGVTQRPVWVARLFKTEAVHFAAFHLVDVDDRRDMARLMGPGVLDHPVARDFSFWYRAPDLRLRHIAPLPRSAARLAGG